ncbi:NCS2 family permease [Aggregatibacter aphrophilus]|uniref:Probable adenine permease PurP n=2 Tax=Aggregatibacter aphrophilus TaxID=732 RepID=A0A336N9C1_AGGAP|nr:NCS2 family permease [Aggregatibacter aphrophilus]KNE86196.1 adenine permease PurP [Aggregatibacter aphrophilus ATCC 33389]OBY55376.1 adenine permease PurP [Aggregatibacter aphrophilus]RDE89171.1 NCS2 family permease [Aggregatibacter aphrophilus]RDE92936.1 NCS2 family permease [Aggregatibacter aphrophilus]SQI98471.1 Probable adenine permease PurP [Aggregatibacter aphrophilus]
MKNQSFLQQFFKLKEKGTSSKTEIIAGITTFFTMVYIVFVNPSVLGDAGMDKQVVFVTTCLIAGFGTIAMGLFSNLPIALAPAMGLNAFFAYVVVGKLGYSWQVGMGTIFWSSVGLLLLTIFQIRYWLMASIPLSLRVGIGAGIGFFIALIGFKNMGLVVANPATLVALGDLHSPQVLLGILGFFIIVVLAARNIYSGVLISIAAVTALASYFDESVMFHGIVSMPPALTQVVGQVDIAGALDTALIGIIFSFLLVNLFDSSGTLLGVTDKAGFSDEKGRFPKMKQALYVDSASAVVGSYIGTSAISTYIESGAGVSVGGRTGMTAVVVGLLFLLTIFFSPLAGMVPAYATAGALVYVGILMASSLIKVTWEDLTEATPAFITSAMMPFTYSITEGIAFGFISYCVMKVGTGRWHEVNAPVWVVSVLFLIKFIWIG